MSMPFLSSPSDVDGTNGYVLLGSGGGDNVEAVAILGDVNGDGIADFLVGATGVAANQPYAGAAYVVYGTRDGHPHFTALADLTAAQGFRIDGPGANDRLGQTVSSAGDLNGDGLADFVVTADHRELGSTDSVGYVVFGRSDFGAVLDLTTLDGSNGFTIRPAGQMYDADVRFASAGDVNGDGIDDLLIGEKSNTTGGDYAGALHVVFGTDQGFDASFDLNTLDGSNGFTIYGSEYQQLGYSLSSAGDLNGDGFADIVVGIDIYGGSYGGGGGYGYGGYGDPTPMDKVYVIFGSGAGFAAQVSLGDLDGTNGFVITSSNMDNAFGGEVGSAGDFNGDGFDDLLISDISDDEDAQDSGAVYVVFGRAGGFAASFDVADIHGETGFRIGGVGDHSKVGQVLAAGDLNGDGLDDIVATLPSPDAGNAYTGGVYVVFGSRLPLGDDLRYADLAAGDGFLIAGVTNKIFGLSVSAGGDVNGDGVDDMIIGAQYGAQFAGAAFVVYGQMDDGETRSGAGGADSLEGGGGDDSLSGLGGKDLLYGLNGADGLDGGDGNDRLYGGAGLDVLTGGLGNDILDGEDGDDQLAAGDGADKLFGGLGVDTLQGGAGADRMDGGTGADNLDGGADNDYLDGGLGADAMTGGLGNDVFIVDNAADTTTEADGQGYDIVRTALDGWVLGANIEGLELQGSGDIDGSGNAGANNLQGNSGANTLSGLAGADTLNGGDGDDIIIGGLGNDLLRGGLGADTFVVAHGFGAVLETDQVYDFSAAEGDILDLSGAYGGTLSLVSGFGKHAGEMTLTFAGGITTLRLDINGDGKVDYQMKINGDVTAESGDWVF
ncbi:MAG: hypothetical protein JWR84_4091 [Caulobacter sp.]|nr:hypothetical protein [Caulobacter sp.]